jgi:hypothetical protein
VGNGVTETMNWGDTPAPFSAGYGASRADVRPEAVEVGSWYSHGLALRATCRCGRVSFLHTGNLIRKFGYQTCFDARALAKLSESCVCIRCKSKGPKLEISVVKD